MKHGSFPPALYTALSPSDEGCSSPMLMRDADSGGLLHVAVDVTVIQGVFDHFAGLGRYTPGRETSPQGPRGDHSTSSDQKIAGNSTPLKSPADR